MTQKSEKRPIISRQDIEVARLHRLMVDHFNILELRLFCLELEVNYDSLPGSGTSEKSFELISFFERQRHLKDLLEALQRTRPNVPWRSLIQKDVKGDSPFKGLNYYNEPDANLFFGREGLTDQLVSRLLPSERDERGNIKTSFLAVVGASGSGKSSLVRAGLIPALRHQTNWPIYLMTPGSHPLKSLATSLTMDAESVTVAAALMDDFLSDVRSLDLYAHRIVPSGRRLLLVVDQFEELFTQCKDRNERRAFIENVMTAVSPANAGPTSVLIAIRADFYHRCGQYDALREALGQQQAFIGPMTNEELRNIIEKPAALYDLRFEPSLIDRILYDVQSEPGSLPLLSHALFETWKNREGNLLTFAGYHATGGVRKSIARTAERVYCNQLSLNQQRVARNIFLRLTEPGEGTPDTRRRILLGELVSRTGTSLAVESVLEIMTSNRLVMIDTASEADSGDAEVVVEVAHEALIREWPRLQSWIDENREGMRIHRRITKAANDWSVRRDENLLYRGALLSEAEKFAQAVPDEPPLHTRHDRIFSIIRALGDFSNLIVKREDNQTLVEARGTRYIGRFNLFEREFLTTSIEARQKRQINNLGKFAGAAVSLALVLFLARAIGQVEWYGGSWQAIRGVYGGNVSFVNMGSNAQAMAFIAIDSRNGASLLTSNDSGSTWTQAESVLPSSRITAVQLDATDSGNVYVSTFGEGVYRSQDWGRSWSPVNATLFNLVISDLAQDHETGTLYLAAQGRDGGVYKSEDDGLNWQRLSQGLESLNVTQLAFDTVRGRIYVATNDRGVFESLNGGESWQPTNLGNLNVHRLVVTPDDHHTLYAGTKTNGVFRSRDGGVNWERLSDGLPEPMELTALTASENQPGVIYLGVKSRGGGQLFRIREDEIVWEVIPQGTAGVRITQIAEHPDDSDVLYLATAAGLYMGKIGEMEWDFINIGHEKVSATGIATGPDDETLFVSVHGGLFRSQDLGTSWEFFNRGFTHPTLRTTVPDPLDPSRIYAGTYAEGNHDVLFVSNTYGSSWESINTQQQGLSNDDIRAMVVDMADPRILYIGTFGSGIYRSTDRGMTWIPINDGITQMEITTMVQDRTSPQTIYAIAAGGPVYKTRDSGASWSALPETAKTDISDLAISPDGKRVCLSIYDRDEGTVQCSENMGSSWKAADVGLESQLVSYIEFGATDFDTLYAGTSDNGIFWSRNGGQSWQAINDGLLNGPVVALHVASDRPDHLYAIVDGQGAFEFVGKYFWDR